MLATDVGLFDVEGIITGAGPSALIVVCLIVFVETGLLIGFLLPGDSLLVLTGVLTFTGVIPQPIWVVAGSIMIATILGDNLGYYIGRRVGPAIFERKSAGFFSKRSVARTEAFFAKYGGFAVTIARFIGVVRTIAPVAAGVGRMRYRTFLIFDTLGAFLWAVGLTFLGWGVAHIPGVADAVTAYIDIVLIGVVVLALGGIGFHALHERREKDREDELERSGEGIELEIVRLDEPEHDGRHEAPPRSRRPGDPRKLVGKPDGAHEKRDGLL
jgi:membrane-associated protein